MTVRHLLTVIDLSATDVRSVLDLSMRPPADLGHPLVGQGVALMNEELSHVAPVRWDHIALTGDYLWSDVQTPRDRFRPLQAGSVPGFIGCLAYTAAETPTHPLKGAIRVVNGGVQLPYFGYGICRILRVPLCVRRHTFRLQTGPL